MSLFVSMGALISFYYTLFPSIRGTIYHNVISSVSLGILLAAYYPLKIIQSRVYYAAYQNMEVTRSQLMFLSFLLAHMSIKFSVIDEYPVCVSVSGRDPRDFPG